MTIRRVVAVVLLCMLAALLAGCATSFQEWSGEMPNETGPHVKPYDVNQQENNNESVQPVVPLLAANLAAVAVKVEVRFAGSALDRPTHGFSAVPAARAGHAQSSESSRTRAGTELR
ncbi:MAG: hypothetical protein KGM47_05490 [Acidobacteriota bacterium]|nr:hypothetical protein [Acidobacteriota bacterium]